MLEVKGNFFEGELIGDGDFVIIESKSSFEDNQIDSCFTPYKL